jgi:hypothetical protein
LPSDCTATVRPRSQETATFVVTWPFGAPKPAASGLPSGLKRATANSSFEGPLTMTRPPRTILPSVCTTTLSAWSLPQMSIVAMPSVLKEGSSRRLAS